MCNKIKVQASEIKGAATDMSYLQGVSSLGVWVTRKILA